MSQFAHILGVIKLNSACPDLRNIVKFENCSSKFKKRLQYKIIQNIVIFWGDLRNKSDEIFDEMLDYLSRIIELLVSENAIIRKGIFEIEVEDSQIRIYRFKFNDGEYKCECVYNDKNHPTDNDLWSLRR